MIPAGFLDTSDALRVSAALAHVGTSSAIRIGVAVRHHGMLLQTKVKAYASKPRTGPPGPRIQTGDYNRSISLNINRSVDTVEAVVGTNKPQGRRLEFGFVGVDAIGRTYNQPPYPHFRPALLEVQPLFLAAIAAIVGGAALPSAPLGSSGGSGGGPRRVRTQAGVERYGKGIGEVI